MTQRIVDIAQAVCPFIALDDNSYFDEAGFVNEMGVELHRRLLEYTGTAEGIDPALDEHPQPRRLARYLLENIEYDVLEAPLASGLLDEFSPDAAKPKTGLIAGLPRHYALAGMAVLLLVLICVVIFFTMGQPSSESEAQMLPKHDHSLGRHGGGRGKGAGWRNGSGPAKL